MNEERQQSISFGEYVLDTDHRQLLRNGEAVPLYSKTIDLLEFMATNHGRVLTKDEILNKVWEGQFVEEANLSVQISNLRKALGENKDSPRFLVTVPGKGYKFVADVQNGDGEIVIEKYKYEQIVIEKDIDEFHRSDPKLLSKTRSKMRNAAIALTAVSILAAGFAGYRYFVGSQSQTITSLAVLPLVSQTGDTDTEYLSDGLAESVTYSLSRFPGMHVTSSNSAFRYKGKDADAKTIGRELNVQAVLMGRTTQAGENFSASVELVSTKDNSVIWGKQFTRKMSEFAKLQSDVARAISQQLKIKLSDSDERRLENIQTQNTDAFKAYIVGRYNWNKRSAEGLKASLENFRQAIDLDPTFALAYAGMADSYIMQSLYGAMPPNDVMPKARASVEKALEIDSDIAEAESSLALVSYLFDYDWEKAEKGFRRSIELKPNYATAHHWFGLFLAMTKRTDEALRELDLAKSLDPLSLSIETDRAFVNHLARRYDEAVKILTETLAIDPNFVNAHYHLGLNLTQQKKYTEAIDEFKTVENLTAGEQGKPELAWVYALSGRKPEARQLLDDIQSDDRFVSPVILSGVFLALHENAKALDLLNIAYQKRDGLLVGITVDPMFDALRQNNAFLDLQKKVS
ncbi:MAG: winged helix-turn-helix domain-containing tetratricopeptide repeat protein [Pyrinomonadaceae bacterium]